MLAGGAVCIFRWHAWFTMSPDPGYVGDTIRHEFVALDHDPTPDSLRLLVLGDVHNHLNHEDWKRLDTLCPDLDGYIQLGDMVERPYFSYYQTLYHQLDSTVFDSLPILAIPGNHEYRKGIYPSLDTTWTQIFPMPQNGPAGFEGQSYYVDLKFVRFIGIDTQGLNHLRDYTRHLTWLNQAIDDADGRFVVVMMHHPIYSSVKHRQNYLLRLFYTRVLRNADLVLAGHDHCYSRRGHFVTINSSHKYYPLKQHPKGAVNVGGVQVYSMLEGNCDSLQLSTYRLEDASLLDEFVVHRQ